MAAKLRNRLADLCSYLGAWFTERSRDLRVCRNCGQNEFYGQPCFGRTPGERE
jgi:hypothetical protein